MTRDEPTICSTGWRGASRRCFGASCESIIHRFLPDEPPHSRHLQRPFSGARSAPPGPDGPRAGGWRPGRRGDLLATTPSRPKSRAATFVCRGTDYHFALGVNFDFTALVYATASSWTSCAWTRISAARSIRTAKATSGKSSPPASKPRKARVRHEQGGPAAGHRHARKTRRVFPYRKAVPYVAERLVRFALYDFTIS